MIPRIGAAVFLALLAAGPAGAGWMENGKEVPDTAWARWNGDLGAQLVLTQRPNELFAAWEKSGPAVLLRQASRVMRGSPVVAATFFAGCARNNRGACDVAVRYSAYAPDGKLRSNADVGELCIGKPAPVKGQMQLRVGQMGVVIAPDDPLGVYTVRAEVVDRISGRALVLERTFTVVEAANR